MMTMGPEMQKRRDVAATFCAKSQMNLFHLVICALPATCSSILFVRSGILGRQSTCVFSAIKMQRRNDAKFLACRHQAKQGKLQ
eukprot:8526884-Ditylum_brightwellii.AAC.1